MCLAIPGKVKEINGMKLTIEYPGQLREAFDGGIPVKIGDLVLVQMGIVIKVLTAKEARITQKSWK